VQLGEEEGFVFEAEDRVGWEGCETVGELFEALSGFDQCFYSSRSPNLQETRKKREQDGLNSHHIFYYTSAKG
jgi:hypothetical protein